MSILATNKGEMILVAAVTTISAISQLWPCLWKQIEHRCLGASRVWERLEYGLALIWVSRLSHPCVRASKLGLFLATAMKVLLSCPYSFIPLECVPFLSK